MKFPGRLLLSVSLVALAGAVPALAGDYPFGDAPDLPAVSAVNGKLGTFAGSAGGDFVAGGFGALTVPFGERFGVQIDGLVGNGAGSPFYGAGAHLFWRDPSQGLIGAYASYVAWDSLTTIPVADPDGGVIDITGAHVGKAGLEAEAYLGPVSLEGFAGYQFGTNTGFAGKATVAFYATEDLRLDLSARYLAGPGAAFSAGFEWQAPGTSASLIADGGTVAGASNQWFAQAGLKVYFGAQQKSLVRRHREDDPDVDLPYDLFKVIGAAHCPEGTVLVVDAAVCIPI